MRWGGTWLLRMLARAATYEIAPPHPLLLVLDPDLTLTYFPGSMTKLMHKCWILSLFVDLKVEERL